MNNEFEYDYFGSPITTHTKEECIETMEYEVLIGDHYYDDTPVLDRIKGGCPDFHQWLSQQDREILIEYAPKLFDTLPKDKDLFNSMLGLATIIGKHRFEVMWQRNEDARMNVYSHGNKSQESKASSLKTHIAAILGIIGIDSYIDKECELAHLRTTKDDFLDELARAYEDPIQYLPRKDSKLSYEQNEAGEMVAVPHCTQGPMKEYLKDLNLKNRSDIIKEFVEKIANQNWFSTFLVKQQRPPVL